MKANGSSCDADGKSLTPPLDRSPSLGAKESAAQRRDSSLATPKSPINVKVAQIKEAKKESSSSKGSTSQSTLGYLPSLSNR